ncbi:MAG: hypothetical protein QXG48_00440 [Thermofilaceae archaeon]
MMKEAFLYAFAIILLWYTVGIVTAEPVVINQPIRIYANGTVYPPNAPIVYSNGVFKLTNDIVVNVTLSSAYDQSRIYEYVIYEYTWCYYPIERIIINMYDFTLTSGVSIIGNGIVFDGGGYSIEVRGPALSILSAEDNNTYLVAHGLFGIYINGTSVTVRNVKVRVYVDRKADADTSFQRGVIPFGTRYGYPVHASIFAFSRQGEALSITLENVIAEPVVITNLDELLDIYPYDLESYRLFSIFVPVETGKPYSLCFGSRGTWRQESEPFFSLLSSIPLAFAQPGSVVTLKNVTASFLVLNATVIDISSSNLSNVFLFSKGSIFLDTSIVTGDLPVEGYLVDEGAALFIFDRYCDWGAPVFNGIFRARRTVFNGSFIYISNKDKVVLEGNTFIDSILVARDNFEVLVKRNTFLSSATLNLLAYYDYETGTFYAKVINVTLNNFYLPNISSSLSLPFLFDAEWMPGLRNILVIQKNFWNGSTVCSLSPPPPGQSFSLSNSEIPFCLIDEGSHTVSLQPDLTGFNWTWTWVRGDPDGLNDIPVVFPHSKTVYDRTTGRYVTFTMYYMLDPYPLYTPLALEEDTLEEGQQQGGEQSPPSQPPPAQPSFPVELPSWVFYAFAVLVVLVIVVFAATRHAIADTRRFVRERG